MILQGSLRVIVTFFAVLFTLTLIESPAAANTAPVIENLSPNPATPGDQVSIHGSGFRPDSKLEFNGLYLDVDFVSGTALRFDLPTGIQCSSYSIQIENPARTIGSSTLPLERSNIRELSMTCGPGSREIPSALNLDSIEPTRGGAGTTVHVIGTSFEAPVTRVLFDNQLITPNITSSTELTFRVPDVSCGQHTVRVQKALVGGPRVLSDRIETFEVLCGDVIRQPGGQILDIEVFDSNSDCILQNAEIFEAMDAWVLRLLDDDVFFDVIDAWVTGRNICIRAMSALRVVNSGSRLLISAQDQNVGLSDAIVYDLSGKAIAQISSGAGSARLIWNMRSSNHTLVPNGVYLISVIQRTPGGDAQSQILKLYVLNSN